MGSRRRCCCGGTTICVTVCYPYIPVYGALVQVYTSSGGSLVASCTTGSGGCCTVPVTGSYYLTITISGTVVYSATRTLAGTITINVNSATAQIVCCGNYAIPYNLTLTDALGSLSFIYYPSYFYPIWYGGRAVNLLSSTVTTPNNVCVVASPTTGPVRVCYQMTCVSGSSPVFAMQRSWSWVTEVGGTNIWYQDPSGITPGQPCSPAPPAPCGNPHTDTASGSANPTTTSPFAISFTMADSVPGNYTGDPVVSGGGDTVSVSA